MEGLEWVILFKVKVFDYVEINEPGLENFIKGC